MSGGGFAAELDRTVGRTRSGRRCFATTNGPSSHFLPAAAAAASMLSTDLGSSGGAATSGGTSSVAVDPIAKSLRECLLPITRASSDAGCDLLSCCGAEYARPALVQDMCEKLRGDPEERRAADAMRRCPWAPSLVVALSMRATGVMCDSKSQEDCPPRTQRRLHDDVSLCVEAAQL